MVALSADLHPSDVVNAHNHGAVLTVVAAYCTTVALIFLCGRLGVRWPWSSCCGRDDATITIASLSAIAQMVLITQAVGAGLGRTPGDYTKAELHRVDQLFYASNLFYIITSSLGRLSVIFLQRRLSGSPAQMRLITYLIAACGVFWFISFLIIAIPYDDTAPWLRIGVKAGNVFGRWVAVETLGSLLDLLIVAYIIHLVWNMQTRRDKKRLVIFLFALRLPLIGIVIARLYSMYTSLHGKDDRFRYITTEIFTEVSICYNLVSATTPVLRIFLRAARTGVHGTIMTSSISGNYRRQTDGHLSEAKVSRSHLSSVLSSSLSRPFGGSAHRSIRAEDDEEGFAVEFPDRTHGETFTTAAAVSGTSDGATIGSHDSEQAIMVQQKVDVTYDILRP